ncbi:MAG: HAD family hydrolase [Pirellulales bacterium]
MQSLATHQDSADAAAVPSLVDYRAWLIDLDGTLYHPLGVRAAMAMELAVSGWRDARIVQAFRREHEQMRRAEVPNSTGSAFDRQIQGTAEKLKLSEEAVTRVVQRWMVDRPGKWIKMFRRRGLISSIARFRTAGGRTALVSDYPAQRKLASLAAVDLFEVVIANGEGGTTFPLKPDPAAYVAAADRLAVPPDQCIVIGDRHDADGLAAQSAGMAFCHVKNMAITPPK